MKKSDEINEISKAMALAQGEMKPAFKGTVNPFFKSRFANLEQVWDSIREPLTKNGLSSIQDVKTTPTGVEIVTCILHSSGQWLEFGPLEMQLLKKDPQSLGSAITYGKRYALCAALGIVTGDEDDDGEAATKPHRKEPQKKEADPDMSQDEIDGYIDGNYSNHKVQFFNFMTEMMKIYKWTTYREAIDQFILHKDQVKNDFGVWLKKNPGA